MFRCQRWPNRSCSVPEYFSRISCSTFRRNFSGFARFELFPRCGVGAPWLLLPDSASTVSSSVDSSTPASLLHLPASASGSSLAPEPLLVEVPSYSSLSSSTGPPLEVRSVGDISNGAVGTLSKRFNSRTAAPQRFRNQCWLRWELGRFRVALKRIWPGDGCEV